MNNLMDNLNFKNIFILKQIELEELKNPELQAFAHEFP